MTWLTFGIKQFQNGGYFEFCNIYLTQEMQNDWTMNLKQNVMSHTRITHDNTKKSQMAASRLFKKNFFHYLGNLAW